MASSRQLKFSKKMVVSSANWQILYSVPAILIPLTLLSDFKYNDIISETKMNKKADSGQPCRTPLGSSKDGERCPLFTVHDVILL